MIRGNGKECYRWVRLCKVTLAADDVPKADYFFSVGFVYRMSGRELESTQIAIKLILVVCIATDFRSHQRTCQR